MYIHAHTHTHSIHKSVYLYLCTHPTPSLPSVLVMDTSYRLPRRAKRVNMTLTHSLTSYISGIIMTVIMEASPPARDLKRDVFLFIMSTQAACPWLFWVFFFVSDHSEAVSTCEHILLQTNKWVDVFYLRLMITCFCVVGTVCHQVVVIATKTEKIFTQF